MEKIYELKRNKEIKKNKIYRVRKEKKFPLMNPEASVILHSIIWLAEHISVCREVQVTEEALCRCDQGWSVSGCHAEDKRGEVTFPQTPDLRGREELQDEPSQLHRAPSSLRWRTCNQMYQLASPCVLAVSSRGSSDQLSFTWWGKKMNLYLLVLENVGYFH